MRKSQCLCSTDGTWSRTALWQPAFLYGELQWQALRLLNIQQNPTPCLMAAKLEQQLWQDGSDALQLYTEPHRHKSCKYCLLQAPHLIRLPQSLVLISSRRVRRTHLRLHEPDQSCRSQEGHARAHPLEAPPPTMHTPEHHVKLIMTL